MLMMKDHSGLIQLQRKTMEEVVRTVLPQRKAMELVARTTQLHRKTVEQLMIVQVPMKTM